MEILTSVFVPVLTVQAAVAKGLIKPLGQHELLLVLLQLSLLLFVARGLGECLRRIDLPPVVGELLAGVLLGPSLFGWLFPTVQAQIFPKSQTQSDLLSVVSWLGVLFLLIVTGLETDLNLIILTETSKGYDLLVLGATEQKHSPGSLFNLLVSADSTGGSLCNSGGEIASAPVPGQVLECCSTKKAQTYFGSDCGDKR